MGEQSCEGLEPVTDESMVEPMALDEAGSFLGAIEASSFPIPDYVSLMKIASDVYAAFFPDKEEKKTDSVSD